MATMNEIEQLTKAYAEKHNLLSEVVTQLNDAIEQLKKQHMRSIKARVNGAAETHAALKAAIDASPELFAKPRTVVFHGVKVGLQKGKGRIEFEDEARVIALIRKHFEESRVEHLVITTESLSKGALAELPVAELKKIGCSVKDADDQVVIKPTDSNVDKLVKALLKDAIDEEAGS